MLGSQQNIKGMKQGGINFWSMINGDGGEYSKRQRSNGLGEVEQQFGW